jgi:NADH-quinone oxidoreductase subunit L
LTRWGGLRSKMPITFWTSAVGVLSLSGVPLFSGFWSKDLVIESTLEAGNTVVYLLVVAASVLTVTYSLRWLYKVFLAPPKGHASEHAHESPPVMTVPLIILAALSVAVGVTGPFFEENFHHYLGLHGEVKTGLTTYLTSAAVLLTGRGPRIRVLSGRGVKP